MDDQQEHDDHWFSLVDVQGFLDPSQMLECASENGDVPPLEDYLGAIQMLRKRGYSFRGIADFLTARGRPATHNQVYYVVRKATHPAEIDDLDHDAEMEDAEEALDDR